MRALPKWLGRCADATLEQLRREAAAAVPTSAARPRPWADEGPAHRRRRGDFPERLTTGTAFRSRASAAARPGSLVLLGGEPGIANPRCSSGRVSLAATFGPVLYCSARTSTNQDARRSSRRRPDRCICCRDVLELLPRSEGSAESRVAHRGLESRRSSPLKLKRLRQRQPCPSGRHGSAVHRQGRNRHDRRPVTSYGPCRPQVLEHVVDTVLYSRSSQPRAQHRRPVKPALARSTSRVSR